MRGLAVMAGLFAVPGVAAVVDPVFKSAAKGWADAGPVAELKDGEAKPFSYEVSAGWEKRKEPGFLLKRGDEIVAMSARCTHLNCKVRFAEAQFRCPCHEGVFDIDGNPKSGPVRKPLDRFEAKVENGRVKVKV